MTVCVGAICEQGKAIVLAADRLVTFGEYTLQVEGNERKIISLAPGIAVAATGTSEDAEAALERLRHSAELMTSAAVRPVANRMQKLCGHLRSRHIERNITRPLLNMSFAKFAHVCSTTPNTQAVTDVFKAVDVYKKFSVQLLVAGIDSDGPHLYLTSHNSVNSYNSTGFCAIGCGGTLALETLVTRGKLPIKRSLPETIYSLFAIKKATEAIPGVGRKTDIAVIRLGKRTQFLPQKQLKALSQIHKRMEARKLSVEDSATIEGFFS